MHQKDVIAGQSLTGTVQLKFSSHNKNTIQMPSKRDYDKKVVVHDPNYQQRILKEGVMNTAPKPSQRLNQIIIVMNGYKQTKHYNETGDGSQCYRKKNESFWNQSIVVKKFQYNEIIPATTTYTIPFSFDIPRNVPPSTGLIEAKRKNNEQWYRNHHNKKSATRAAASLLPGRENKKLAHETKVKYTVTVYFQYLEKQMKGITILSSSNVSPTLIPPPFPLIQGGEQAQQEEDSHDYQTQQDITTTTSDVTSSSSSIDYTTTAVTATLLPPSQIFPVVDGGTTPSTTAMVLTTFPLNDDGIDWC